MKQQIIDALRKFIGARPGLEFANYGDAAAYRAEMRGITRDLGDARTLLRAVEWRGVTAEALLEAARGSRLTINADASLDYCTGQYYPTEYRRAVAAICARALWNHWRSPATTGDTLRNTARREFGRGLAGRYFS
jgi:hypothetical protein